MTPKWRAIYLEDIHQAMSINTFCSNRTIQQEGVAHIEHLIGTGALNPNRKNHPPAVTKAILVDDHAQDIHEHFHPLYLKPTVSVHNSTTWQKRYFACAKRANIAWRTVNKKKTFLQRMTRRRILLHSRTTRSQMHSIDRVSQGRWIYRHG